MKYLTLPYYLLFCSQYQPLHDMTVPTRTKGVCVVRRVGRDANAYAELDGKGDLLIDFPGQQGACVAGTSTAEEIGHGFTSTYP